MTKLEQKELQLKTQEIINKKHERILGWIKLISGIIGAIIFFYLIQKPESLINRQASTETKLRERAKLILSLRMENDPELLKEGLKIIKHIYPETDESWITDYENELAITAEVELPQFYNREYENLKNQANVIKANMGNPSLSEWEKKKAEWNLRSINIQMSRIKAKIDSLKTN